MDGQTEWTYSQSCLWSKLKNDKLNRGIPVDTKRSFSFVPYLLWYPGGQELGYLILKFYRILLTTFQMCFIRRLIQAIAFGSM